MSAEAVAEAGGGVVLRVPAPALAVWRCAAPLPTAGRFDYGQVLVGVDARGGYAVATDGRVLAVVRWAPPEGQGLTRPYAVPSPLARGLSEGLAGPWRHARLALAEAGDRLALGREGDPAVAFREPGTDFPLAAVAGYEALLADGVRPAGGWAPLAPDVFRRAARLVAAADGEDWEATPLGCRMVATGPALWGFRFGRLGPAAPWSLSGLVAAMPLNVEAGG